MYNNLQNYLSSGQAQAVGGSAGLQALQGGLAGSVTAAPAQKPTEYAQFLLNQAGEMNDRLKNLRFRLFGDSDIEAPASSGGTLKPEGSLEAMIQSVHFMLSTALVQLDGIQNRL